MAAAPEAPTLFLRKATGLVKGWNAFDAFIYAFMSVNLVSLGMYYSFSSAPFIPDGQQLPAILITGFFVSFLVIAYAGLIATMPRAGGDYVWQSRILSGGVAFVLAVTGWWFILWHWAPIYGNILATQFFQPIFTIFGNADAASWFTTNNGVFVISLVVILMVAGLVALGMETYARFQKVCFWGALAGLAIMLVLMAVSSQADFQAAFNREAASQLGLSGDAYARTIEISAENGYRALPLGWSPFFGPTWLLVPFMVFYLLYPNWGATLYGEVRGASDFRRVFNGMFWGLWVTVILSIVFLYLAHKTFGWDFFMAANNNFWSGTAELPIFPYPPLLAAWLVDNSLFQLIVVLLSSLWFFGWMGTLFLSSTRVIFAAAFDRILPEWAASVSERRHVPVGALMLMLIPSIIVSALYAYYGDFRTFTLDATLVIAVTYLGTAISATILPWRRPQMWSNSPASRYTIAGIPLVPLAGAITSGFIVFLLYEWLKRDVYFVNNPTSLRYLAVLYLLALVIYVVAKVVRKRQGVDLTRIHQEIPVE